MFHLVLDILVLARLSSDLAYHLEDINQLSAACEILKAIHLPKDDAFWSFGHCATCLWNMWLSLCFTEGVLVLICLAHFVSASDCVFALHISSFGVVGSGLFFHF